MPITYTAPTTIKLSPRQQQNGIILRRVDDAVRKTLADMGKYHNTGETGCLGKARWRDGIVGNNKPLDLMTRQCGSIDAEIAPDGTIKITGRALYKAGFRVGDRITSIDGNDLRGSYTHTDDQVNSRLAGYLYSTYPGQVVKIAATKKDDALSTHARSVKLLPPIPYLYARLSDNKKGPGVVIDDMDRNSCLCKAGFMPGETITAVNGCAVNNLNDLKDILSRLQGNNVTYFERGMKRPDGDILKVILGFRALKAPPTAQYPF